MNSLKEDLPLAVAILLLAGLSFSLACQLTSSPVYSSFETPSAWSRLLGSATTMLSADLYEVADQYFHKGVPHMQAAAFDDPFQRIRAVMSPSEHAHPSGDKDLLEIMPWLSLAVKIDPHNIEAWQVAVYWLKQTGKIDKARAVLRKAIDDNPHDYRLWIERALIAGHDDDAGKAGDYFDVAMKLWPSGMDPNEDEARLDLGRALQYRALLYELDGNYAAAIDMLQKEFAMFPSRTSIPAHIERLESGQIDQQELVSKWKLILKQKPHFECGEPDHEHEHDQDPHLGN